MVNFPGQHADIPRSSIDKGVEYKKHDFIYVRGSNSNGKFDIWIAYVIEIRSESVEDCFLRVFWLYRPEDLPKNVSYAGRYLAAGRQSYHGRHEMIVSNDSTVPKNQPIDAWLTV
jgi:hypothetical protein